MQPLIVTIHEAPRDDLKGVVSFKHPTIYDHFAIGRRTTELANTGAADGAPRYAVSDLPFRQQESIYLIATLEHVITTAPAGFYRTEKGTGHPVLDLGQFDEWDAEPGESFLYLLYAAYLQWRSDFRRSRRSHPE